MTIKIGRPSFVHEDSRFYQYFSKLIQSIEGVINSESYKVEVDDSDTTPDKLFAKLQPGLNVALSIVNPGANEKVKIDATTVNSFKVLVDGSDTTPDDLLAKLQAGSNISLSVVNPGGNEKVQIDAGGGGGSFPSPYIIWISADANPVGADGSFSKPFTTIQNAINSIPPVTTPAQTRHVYVLLIAPGSYDEDVTIDGTSKHICLLGLGPWNLGLFAPGVSNWDPTGTPRNIIWNINAGNIESVRHSLNMGTIIDPYAAYTSHPAYNTSPRISGKIIINDNVLGGTTKELYVQAQIYDAGATGKSIDFSVGTGILNFYCFKSRFATQVFGASLRIQYAILSRFSGLINVNNYTRVDSCYIQTGMTIAVDIADLQPSGMINTNFNGTFTGPINSCRLDGNTNYWFKTNASILAGGATKVIQDDLIP